MENLKVYVKNEAESKEVQDLFFELGGDFYFGGKLHCNTHLGLVTINKDGLMANIELQGFDYVEITIQQLRDLVVLKRNDVNDANLKDTFGDIWYVDSTNSYWMFENDIWREADEPLFKLEPIKKEGEMKKKEYIAKVSGNWRLVDSHELVSGRIEVPEGAEILYFGKRYESANHFFKIVDGKSYYKYLNKDSKWREYSNTGLNDFKEIIDNFRVMWKRNPETPKTSIQEKLKFIEKWLNGQKIQYILAVESDKIQSEKTQWHNFTEGAMQYIKRSDIKFREAPKYVTINGIEFKSVESLLKYVKNNFDLEDGE